MFKNLIPILAFLVLFSTACFVTSDDDGDLSNDDAINAKSMIAVNTATSQAQADATKRSIGTTIDYTCPDDTCTVSGTSTLGSIDVTVTFYNFVYDGLTLNGSADYSMSSDGLSLTITYSTGDTGLSIATDDTTYDLLWDISISASSSGLGYSFDFSGTYTINDVTVSYDGTGYVSNL